MFLVADNMESFKDNDECNCGNDHCHDNCEEHIVTITLDDDTEVKCSLIGDFEFEDKRYIALLPENEEEVLLYRCNGSDDDEELELSLIESDEEFDKVEEVFYSLFDEED